MSDKANQPTAEETSVAIDGAGLVLDKTAKAILAGYFDVLIQMDLEQKALARIKERNESNENDGRSQAHNTKT